MSNDKINKFGSKNAFQPLFHPYDFEHGQHAVEKEEGGKKRKYLQGFSSGLDVDAHGECMTENAVKSFMAQANSGNMLLYSDVHGISASKDIGKLVKCEITQKGDWFTVFKLHDEDDFDPQLHREKFATIDSTWKQANGLPPYDHPMQKGFSIEGFIPEEDGVIKMTPTGQRVINNVELDGVVLVPRPAYQTGIANAVFKSLGKIPPWVAKKVKKDIVTTIQQIINDKENKKNFATKKFELDSALEDAIVLTMKDPKGSKSDRLNIIFDEYKRALIDLLLSSQGLFEQEREQENKKIIISKNMHIQRIYKHLQVKMLLLKNEIIRIKGE